MILAGQRLVDYRKSQFDFEGVDKIDYDFNDPSRSLGLMWQTLLRFTYL